MQRVVAYTDGSAKGNPGPGGYGVVLSCVLASGREARQELSEGFRRTTNNRMELLAVIVALEALKRPCAVTLYSDSRYVVDAVQKRWLEGWQRRGWKTAGKAPVKNIDLWQRFLEARKPHEVEFRWVKGHAGNPGNERCDELAQSAADRRNLPADAGFEG